MIIMLWRCKIKAKRNLTKHVYICSYATPLHNWVRWNKVFIAMLRIYRSFCIISSWKFEFEVPSDYLVYIFKPIWLNSKRIVEECVDIEKVFVWEINSDVIGIKSQFHLCLLMKRLKNVGALGNSGRYSL